VLDIGQARHPVGAPGPAKNSGVGAWLFENWIEESANPNPPHPEEPRTDLE